MFCKMKIIFGIMLMSFCLSTFIGCSSPQTEDEIIEAFDKGKISEKEFIKRMDALEALEALDNKESTNIDLSAEYKDYIK